ncbi:MAG: transporter substrate-binding domain-containing protein [Rhodocyclaceae bacterium]|jgi:polar amino acid transport system substrate-binding protein|nr:transporter substrate-binding domain-containing protein [Rhodocyclaceae bacterium]
MMNARLPTSLLLLGLLSAPALALDLTVGVESSDYLPISKGDSGTYVGYARDVLDAFAAKYGHKFTYKAMPVARLYDEFLVQKSVDLKFPDNPIWAQNLKQGATISYSKGLVTVTEGLMVTPANKGKGLAAVGKISTLRGFTPWPYMDQIKTKKISVSEVNSAEAAIKMVEGGRVDGVYLGTLATTYIMNEVLKQPGMLVFDDKLPNSKNDFTISSIAHPNVIKQMDEFLVTEKDTVAKIKSKYKISD